MILKIDKTEAYNSLHMYICIYIRERERVEREEEREGEREMLKMWMKVDEGR